MKMVQSQLKDSCGSLGITLPTLDACESLLLFLLHFFLPHRQARKGQKTKILHSPYLFSSGISSFLPYNIECSKPLIQGQGTEQVGLEH